MAGPYTCYNANGFSINNSNILIPIFVVFCTLTLASTQIPALIQVPASTLAFVFALGLPKRYTNENLQKTYKLALKLFIKG